MCDRVGRGRAALGAHGSPRPRWSSGLTVVADIIRPHRTMLATAAALSHHPSAGQRQVRRRRFSARAGLRARVRLRRSRRVERWRYGRPLTPGNHFWGQGRLRRRRQETKVLLGGGDSELHLLKVATAACPVELQNILRLLIEAECHRRPELDELGVKNGSPPGPGEPLDFVLDHSHLSAPTIGQEDDRGSPPRWRLPTAASWLRLYRPGSAPDASGSVVDIASSASAMRLCM
jgi:hypothetical protein